MAHDTIYTSFNKVIKETTYGTAVAPTLDVLLLDSVCTINETQNKQRELGAGSRKANQISTNQYGVSGSLSGKVQGGRLFAYALGVDTTTGASVPYTHTLANHATNALSSLTLDKAHINTDKGQRVSGVKINDFGFNLDTNGQLTSTFNWIGQEVIPVTSTVGTRSTASTSTVYPSWMAATTWNSNTIEITTCAFNYNNNLATEEFSCGERRIKALPEGQIDMDISFTLVFSDFTVYDDFQTTWTTETSNEEGTARTFAMTLNNGGTTTAEREIALSFTATHLNEVSSPTTMSSGRVVQEFTALPLDINTFTFKDNVDVDYITND